MVLPKINAIMTLKRRGASVTLSATLFSIVAFGTTLSNVATFGAAPFSVGTFDPTPFSVDGAIR